jgi:hypothetical protein
MGWRWGAAAVLLLAPVAGFAGSTADAQELPTVTIESGPTTSHGLPYECTDGIQSADEPREFVISRDEASPSPLVVHYTVAPSDPFTTSGGDYVPLPGDVTILANETSARVPLHPLTSPTLSKVAAIMVTVSPSGDYDVGSPAVATLQFVVLRDPELGPVVCDPTFEIADVASNKEQTIHVGQRPSGIVTTKNDAVRMRLLEGELPPGVSLIEQFDTTEFSGAATTVGITTANLQLCNGTFSVTCRQTTLVVHVVAGDGSISTTAVGRAGELPRTGAAPLRELLVALFFIGVGAAMLCKARVDAATHPAHHHRRRVGSRAG